MNAASLTAVRLLHRPERADAWLRFGHPLAERRRGRRGVAWFAPGSLFGHVDWRANDYGTIRWTFVVARAVSPGAAVQSIAGVSPGAELLLAVSGKAAVKRALAYVDAIEAAGLDPAEVPSRPRWRSQGRSAWRRTRSRAEASAEDGGGTGILLRDAKRALARGGKWRARRCCASAGRGVSRLRPCAIGERPCGRGLLAGRWRRNVVNRQREEGLYRRKFS